MVSKIEIPSIGRRHLGGPIDDDAAELLAGMDDRSLDELLDGIRRSELSDYGIEVPSDPDERRAWAEESLINFMKAYLPHYLKSEFADFHYEFARICYDVALCRGEYKEKLGFIGAAPRHHAKSSFASLALILYCILYKKKRFIIIFSDSDIPQAKTIAANIKAELDENELIKRDFGNLNAEDLGRRWAEQDFLACHQQGGAVTYETRVLSRGVNSRIRGLRQREARPDLIILDDCENDKNIQRATQREGIFQWFIRVILPMLDDKVGRVLVIGTVLHQDSLLSRMLAQAEEPDAEFVGRKWKAIQDDGTALWPQVWPIERLLRIKKRNAFAFATEYQNDPIDEETRRVRPEWIQWYTNEDLVYNKESRSWTFRGLPLTIYAFVDPAISEEELADEFAMVVIGVPRDRKHVLVLYVYHARIDFAAQVTKIINISNTFNCRRVGIESNAYQKALPQVVRRRLSDNRVRPVKRFLRKFDRITGVSPIFQQGTVMLRMATEEEDGRLDQLQKTKIHHTMIDFYDQVTYWPSSPHQDMFDAFEGSIHVAGGTEAFFQDLLPGAA